MSKWCYNYDSGDYEDIDEDGYSHTQGCYVSRWDDSAYQRDHEEDARHRKETALYLKALDNYNEDEYDEDVYDCSEDYEDYKEIEYEHLTEINSLRSDIDYLERMEQDLQEDARKIKDAIWDATHRPEDGRCKNGRGKKKHSHNFDDEDINIQIYKEELRQIEETIRHTEEEKLSKEREIHWEEDALHREKMWYEDAQYRRELQHQDAQYCKELQHQESVHRWEKEEKRYKAELRRRKDEELFPDSFSDFSW